MKVLFVCLGNICRSPLGEGVFKKMIRDRGLEDRIEVDSCGTGAYHVGELPDKRMREVAFSHGVNLDSRARQFSKQDFSSFDYIIAMDRSNYANVSKLNDSKGRAQLLLMREFDEFSEGNLDVPDPYYGGISGFEEVYQIVSRSCKALLDKIENEA